MTAGRESTEKLTIKLSAAEVEALDALAARLGVTREDALRRAFLRGLKTTPDDEYESFSEREIGRLVEIAPATNARLADLWRDGPDDHGQRP